MKRLAMIMMAALMLVFSVGGLAEGSLARYEGAICSDARIQTMLKDQNDSLWDFVEIDIQTGGRGQSNIILRGKIDDKQPYEAYYTFGGQLSHCSFTYKDGCNVSYSRDGEIFMGDNFKVTGIEGIGTVEWVDGKWMQFIGGENSYHKELEDPSKVADIDQNPIATHPVPTMNFEEVKPFVPPQNVMDAYSDFNKSYAEMKNVADDFFPQKYNDAISGTHFERNNRKAVLKFDPTYGLMVGTYTKSNSRYEVYIGTLCFNFESKMCVIAGDPRYGGFTRAMYNWDTGELIEFVIGTPDKSVNAGFTNKNVLQSYEVWSRTDGRWNYEQNEDSGDFEWQYNPEIKGGTFEVKEPTEDVLRKILLVRGVASYDTVCATSVSAVEDTTVPFILAPKSTIGNATVSVDSQRISETETEYDISLSGDARPTQTVTLSLPYPNGMTPEIAQDYGFAVVHEKTGGGTDKMSSVAGSVTLTDHGLEVETDSFSPFTVDWGKKSEIENRYPDAIPGNLDTGSLPQTGDASNLPLLLAVLAASVCALALVLRKRSVCR